MTSIQNNIHQWVRAVICTGSWYERLERNEYQGQWEHMNTWNWVAGPIAECGNDQRKTTRKSVCTTQQFGIYNLERQSIINICHVLSFPCGLSLSPVFPFLLSLGDRTSCTLQQEQPIHNILEEKKFTNHLQKVLHFISEKLLMLYRVAFAFCTAKFT